MKAVITITDMPEGTVSVKLDFGEEGATDSSPSHQTAVRFLEMLKQDSEEDD